MHPLFWPVACWLNFLMWPWKIAVPVAASLGGAAAAANPAAVAGLDPVSPKEIGTSATDLRYATKTSRLLRLHRPPRFSVPTPGGVGAAAHFDRKRGTIMRAYVPHRYGGA
jgi:hypothetical protein